MRSSAGSEPEVSRLFNEMGAEYDLLIDLWYSWLFSRLHVLILKFLEESLKKRYISNPMECLDVGCGTGFQSVLLSLCGANVHGIDIADKLVRVAGQKKPSEYLARDLFFTPFEYGNKYNEQARFLANEIREERRLGKISYIIGSATDLSYQSSSFDVLNCCGSTLNFIDDYQKAIREMHRVMKPGGLLFLEVENKYNLDLIWAVLDAILNKSAWYHQSLKEAAKNLLGPRDQHIRIDFPFTGLRGEEINMKIWLFSRRQLLGYLRQVGFNVMEYHGIHGITNIIPSVKLDEISPSRWTMSLFRVLRRFEEALGSRVPLKGLGCSLVVFARKSPA